MSQRISILVALEGADEGLKRALTSAERSLSSVRRASSAKVHARPSVRRPIAFGAARAAAKIESSSVTRRGRAMRPRAAGQGRRGNLRKSGLRFSR